MSPLEHLFRVVTWGPLVALLTAACSPPARPLDYRSLGYDRFNTYIYQVGSFDRTQHLLRIDTLGLFCSDVVMPSQDSQMVMQWQLLRRSAGHYVLDPDRMNNTTTGIRTTSDALYIHPPREGAFRELQFVPHPLFRDLGRTGNIWSWDLAVGAYWSTPPRYLIRNVDTLHFSYRVQATDTAIAAFPGLRCTAIVAQSASRFGACSAVYYLSPERGLIGFVLATPDRHYSFRLIDTLAGKSGPEINPGFSFATRRTRTSGVWY